MQSWSRSQEIEKPRPQSVDLLEAVNRMDAWLSNHASIQSLSLEEIIDWREAVARHLGVAPQSWFERMDQKMRTP